MMKLGKYKTACGGYLSISARVQSHLLAHPDVITHLPEAASKLHLPSDGMKLECEVPMGRVIGRSGVVTTHPIQTHHRALFALRNNRKFPSRVAAPGAVGNDSTTVVVIAKPRAGQGEYELITAWVGALARKEPWDPHISTGEEFEDCLRFWSTTALVFDAATMAPAVESNWAEVLASAGVMAGEHAYMLQSTSSKSQEAK
ncbi:hypothetical protein [Janthinobacterium sp. HH104]|uniref:hypothetical protein n=1 Tax=Janthinobacterium sp. HH104 TaxID=1537276 RepID=UPI0011130F17|nr:hypothetical protein [Janthinobacterium sp. HH104]